MKRGRGYGDAPTVPSLERVQHKEDAASEFPPFALLLHPWHMRMLCCLFFYKSITTNRILDMHPLFVVLVVPKDFPSTIDCGNISLLLFLFWVDLVVIWQGGIGGLFMLLGVQYELASGQNLSGKILLINSVNVCPWCNITQFISSC